MADAVFDLANLITLRKAEGGEKFVLMLGAGASLSSGIKGTQAIKEALLKKDNPQFADPDIDDRFDALWQRTSDDDRARFLEPFLKQEPSPGYQHLADLIIAGYFDLVVSFNYDRLLEEALNRKGFTDYRVIVRGDSQDEVIHKLIDQKAPRVKLLKMHGSLQSANYFLFDFAEMHKYPAPIESLLLGITRKDMLVCGYAFNDICVTCAFSTSGGPVFCVDPGGVPRNLRFAMKNRRSESRGIPSPFDPFFQDLHAALTSPPGIAAAPPPALNPFKFLESYEEADAEMMQGREEETATFMNFLDDDPPPRVIVLAGPGKVGKTSLVKCRLLPKLDPARYVGLYQRCHLPIEAPPALVPAAGDPPDDGRVLPTPELQALAAEHPDRRIVLFLDQFDRVASRFEVRTTQGARDFTAFLERQLFAGLGPNLTVVLVIADDGVLGGTLIQECNQRRIPANLVMCRAFSREQVADIIRALAAKGGVEFDPRIIDEMAKSYEESHRSPWSETRFTFAHIHAVCHILASTSRVDYESYKAAFKANLDALHRAINVSDIISFVDDFPWPHTVWMRNMIKVPLKESRDRIADFIKLHYQELIPKTQAARSRAPAGGAERTG